MLSIKKLVTCVAIVLVVYTYTYPSLNSEKCYWKQDYHDVDIFKSSSEDELVSPAVTGVPRDIRMMAIGDPQINGIWPSTTYFKRLDCLINDFYLGHAYSVMKKRLDPDYVAMMGDLLSSQWIGDSEFFNRTRRLIQRSFIQPKEQCLTQLEVIDKHEDLDWKEFMHDLQAKLESGYYRTEEAYHHEDVYDWTNGTFLDSKTGRNTEPLFLNITGNHDIGYGDTTFQHMTRWVKLYGDANFWIEYDNGTEHPWRIVVLNSLALDGPLLEPDFQECVWQFLETLDNKEYNGSTILLTHIPMYKREGLCKDGPNFEYFEASGCHGCHPNRVGLLKSQNHLSAETSQKVLDAVFKGGKGGIVLTGHDHYGCDNYYNRGAVNGEWVASKEIEGSEWIREVTVRSIMAEFNGNVGIMTGHFNRDDKKWEFDYTECLFTNQYVYWLMRISVILAIIWNTLDFIF